MDKVIKHGLQIVAKLDAASQKEVRTALHNIFTEESHIDFSTPENVKALKEFAVLFRDIFDMAGNKNFDFAKTMNLEDPIAMFNELKTAAKEFESVWESIVTKFGSGGLQSIFMKNQHELETALGRLTNAKGEMSKKNIDSLNKAINGDVKSKDINYLMNKAIGAKGSFLNSGTWEKQTQAAIEYYNVVQRIRELTHFDILEAQDKGMRMHEFEDVFKNLKNLGPYTIQQLESALPYMKTSLQNILNLSDGSPLIGLTEGGAVDISVVPKVVKPVGVGDVTGGSGKIEVPVELVVDSAAEKASAAEESQRAAEAELETQTKTTAELEKQKKLFLYRYVDGKNAGKGVVGNIDYSKISGMSGDALYDLDNKPNLQKTLELGYGAFGDGLYGVMSAGVEDMEQYFKDSQMSVFGFDASGYKFHVNKTVEQAEMMKNFSLSLQKFVSEGSLLDVSELGHIEDLSEDQLFDKAKQIFQNFSMTKEQFHAWLENAKIESENIKSLFDKGETPSNYHHFGTRFMQSMGYEGVLNDTGDPDFDGINQGSVIFDPDVEKIKSSMVVFNTFDELLSHVAGSANSVEGEIADINAGLDKTESTDVSHIEHKIKSYEELCEAVKKYNNLVMRGVTRSPQQNQEMKDIADSLGLDSLDQETLNGVQDRMGLLNQTKLAQVLGIEIPQAAGAAQQAIDGVVQTQAKLNTTESQNPPAQDNSGVHNANADAIQNENQSLKEKIALLKEISNAYTKQFDAEDKMNNAEGDKAISNAETKYEAAKEVVEGFEDQYHSAMITMQDGSKINIPLDDEFAETTQNILANAKQIQNIDLIPKSAESAMQAYQRIDMIQKNVSNGLQRSWGNAYNGKGAQALEYLIRARADLEACLSNMNQGDPSGQWDLTNAKQTATQLLSTIESMQPKFAMILQMETKLKELNIAPDSGQYYDVIEGIKNGTFTTVDQCIAKFKELEAVVETSGVGGKATGRIAKTKQAVLDFFGGSKKFTSDKRIKPEVITPTSESTPPVSSTSGSTDITPLVTEIKALTSAINTKMAGTDTDADTSAKSFDAEALKSVLTSITYNTKIVSDIDGESGGRTEPVNEEPAQQTIEGKEPWALESTLSTTIKNVLDQIQANTAGQSKESQGKLALDTTLQSAKAVLDNIYVALGQININQPSQEIVSNASSPADNRAFITDEDKLTRLDKLTELETKLKNAGSLTEDADKKIKNLFNSLNQTSDASGLEKWDKQFDGFINKIETLKPKYEELGKLMARRDSVPEGQRAVLDNQIKQLEEVIAKKREELGINAELYEPSRIAAYNAEMDNLIAKQREAAAKEDLRISKENFNTQVQRSRSEARLTQANSTSSTADKLVHEAMSIDSVTPENLARLKEYQVAAQQLSKTYNDLHSKGKIITPDETANIKSQTQNVRQMNEEFRELLKQHERLSGDNALVVGQNQLGANANLEQQRRQLMQAAIEATNGRARIGDFNAATGELAVTMKHVGTNEVSNYTFSMDKLTGSLVQVYNGTKRLMTPLQVLGKKVKEFSYYFTGSMMIYRVIAWVREGVTAIKEIDKALTELKKVTNETEESYSRFLNTASKTAEKIGSTIADFTRATATFAKLGYDMTMASEMAEAAVVYQNVGDGIESADAAAESIISTIKGFNMEASESMEIVDRFNEVGNRFSITSKGIGDALQRSASALSSAGNTLDESIGLITAANEVVQDPESVGTALKTLSLRLRGAKTELEEAGLETENMAETTATLQKKLLGLTGGKVDIMLDVNTFKNTTEILREMSGAWEDMTDIQQAAALELMGGKRQANILSSIIQNFDTVESVIEASANSSNSALEENTKWMDSIEGKTKQFTNAVNTMWNNEISGSIIKGLVDIGTLLVKLIDTLGLIPSVLAVISGYIMISQKMGLITFLQGISNSILKTSNRLKEFAANFVLSMQTTSAATDVATVSTLKNAMATAGLDAKEREAILTKMGLIDATNTQAIAQSQLSYSTFMAMVNEGKLSQSQANTIMSLLGITRATNEVNAARMNELLIAEGLDKSQRRQIITQLGLSGSLKQLTYDEVVNTLTTAGMTAEDAKAFAAKIALTGANTGLAASFNALWTAMWPILAVMAGIAVIYGVVKLFDAMHISAEEASEQLKETKNTISSLESELETLQTDLEETKNKLAELTALPSLSLTQQEDLDRLEREVELLERQIALKERQLAIEENKLVEDAETAIEKKWNKSGAYDSTIDGKIQADKWYTWGESGKDVINEAIAGYNKKASDINILKNHIQSANDDGFVDMNSTLKETYGIYSTRNDGKVSVEQIQKKIDEYDKIRIDIASSIEDFFNDPDYAGLSYGMSDEIDDFLDDFKNTQLKWEKALYGDASKSNAIKDLWGLNATEEIKNLKSEIDKIMATDDDWETKNVAIKALIPTQRDIEGYQQLDWIMENIGVTAQNIADYFTVLNGEFNSNTIEGVTKQYADVTEVINKFKNGLSAIGTDSDGKEVSINFDDLFTFDDETKKWQADAEKVSQILKGADEKTRKQFATYITNIKNAQQEAEDAGKDFDITAAFTQASKNIEIDGLLRVIDITKESLSSINKITFRGIADEIDGLIDTFDEFGKALEDTASAMDTLYKAQEQMNSSGRISVKTALELMQSTEDWNSVLKINGDTITLQDNAEQSLIQSRLNLIEQNINTALSEAELQYAKLEGADATLLQGDADLATIEAQKEFDKAMNQSAAVSAGLGAAAGNLIEKLRALAKLDFDSSAWDTSITNAFSNAYDSALTVLDKQSSPETAEEISQRIVDLRAQKDMIGQLKKNSSAFKDYYDYDKTPGDKYDETGKALEALQKKYEGILSNLENQKTYLENEIDRLEATGSGVSKSYYEEQIDIANQTMDVLAKEHQELKDLFAIDPSQETADALWDIEHRIQEVGLSAIEASKSIVDLYATAFDGINEAYDHSIKLDDDKLSYLQGYAELLELRGEIPNKGLFEEQKNIVSHRKGVNLQKKADTEAAIARLRADRDTYDPWSYEWQQYNDEILRQEADARQIELDIQTDDKDFLQVQKDFEDALLTAWDNVMEAFNNKDAFYEHQQNFIDSYISRFETLGMNVPDEAYQKQAEIQKLRNENNNANLVRANSELENLKAELGEDSDEYIAKMREVAELELERYEGETKLLEYEQKIFDNRIDRFNQVIDRINDATQTLQNVSSLMDNEDVATEDGEWTDEGITRLGLAYQQMEYNKQAAAEVAEKMAEVERQYNNNEISEKKYYETMKAIEDQQWSAINSYEDMKDAIVDINEARIDMIEEGINKEIEAYQELIDLKKEELDAERDLYDFKKNIEKQTKDIAALERRIASMSGSTDASTIAERTKLEAELLNAKDELDGTYRDHAYDSMSDALDNEIEAYTKSSEDYIESIRESIKDIDLVVEQTYQTVLENTDIVLETIEAKVGEYDLYINPLLTSPWENAQGSALDLETAVNTHIDNITSKVNTSTSPMTADLTAPWGEGEKNVNSFGKAAEKTINDAVWKAQSLQDQMQTALSTPWSEAQKTITEWGNKVNNELYTAIQRAKNAAVEMEEALDIKYPDYTGKDTGGNGDVGNSGKIDQTSVAKDWKYTYSASVAVLQKILKQFFGANLGTYGVDGKYGEAGGETWEAVKKMQQFLKTTNFGGHVTVNGKYDTSTKDAMQKYLNSLNVSSWFMANKLSIPSAMFAKGTLGTSKDQWAITDESWIGEEITLAAGKNGQLQYLKKGSAVMPADISANLVEWGKLDPTMMNLGDMSGGIQMMSNYVNKPEIKLDIENFLNVGTVSNDTLPELEKLMDKKIDTFAKQLNASIRKFK